MKMIAVKGFNVRRNGSIISEMRLVWIPGRRPVKIPMFIPMRIIMKLIITYIYKV